jgi:hypothetical protein
MDEVLDIALVAPVPGAVLRDRATDAAASDLPADGSVTH